MEAEEDGHVLRLKVKGRDRGRRGRSCFEVEGQRKRWRPKRTVMF